MWGFYFQVGMRQHNLDFDFPRFERDTPIYFSIANKSRSDNKDEFPVNVHDRPKPKPQSWNLGFDALPRLLPKEEEKIQEDVKPLMKITPKPKPEAVPKQTPKPAPKKAPMVPTTVDYLKQFHMGKSKVPITTLTAEKESPATWFRKVPVSDTGADEVTLVTAYLNIGRYKNDDNKYIYTPENFRRWMTSFCSIQNPVVVFMNDDSDLRLFGNIRSNVPNHRTKMYKVSKSSLWSFSLLSNISKIYKTFPKHSPSTTVPHYTSVTIAKYEFLAIAMKENPFNTKYISWIDIGLFRNLATPVARIGDPLMTLYLPPMIDQNKIAYGQTHDRNEDLNPNEVLRLRKQWISGSIFTGKVSTMKKWILQYVKYVDQFLQMGIMGTDQYLLYAMFQTKEELDVDIQTYTWQGHYNLIHHLGFICRDEGARKNRMSRFKSAVTSKPESVAKIKPVKAQPVAKAKPAGIAKPVVKTISAAKVKLK